MRFLILIADLLMLFAIVIIAAIAVLTFAYNVDAGRRTIEVTLQP